MKSTTGFAIAFLIISFLVWPISQTFAGEIYSNLGPNGEFYAGNGYSISYEDGYGGQAMAHSFESSSDTTLVSVELPVYIDYLPPGASDKFSVGVYQDVDGAPGPLLGSATGQALPQPPAGLVLVAFPDPIELQANTRYWLGVHPFEPKLTGLAWYFRHQALESSLVNFWQTHWSLPDLFVGGTFEQLVEGYETAFRLNNDVVFCSGFENATDNGCVH